MSPIRQGSPLKVDGTSAHLDRRQVRDDGPRLHTADDLLEEGIPHKLPLGIAALASQKNHMAIYLMGLYGSEPEEAWFREEYAKRGMAKTRTGKWQPA